MGTDDFFCRAKKTFASQEKPQDSVSAFRLHGCYSRCEYILVEPLLSLLSKLPTGKNLILNSGILSALLVLPWKLQRLSWHQLHQNHGPKTHSLNLPGCVIGLKHPHAAGVKHLSLPVSSNHLLGDSLYASKGHTQFCEQFFGHKRQIFVTNCGIRFLVSPSIFWFVESIFHQCSSAAGAVFYGTPGLC